MIEQFVQAYTNQQKVIMKLSFTLTFLLLLSCSLLWGQTTYLLQPGLTNITGCNGFFMDSGGGDNPYGPNENHTVTICPDLSTGTHVQLVFTGTQIGAGDNLCFFDGPSTGSPSLGCAFDFGGNPAFIIQATAANPSGCLTVTFTSDAVDEGAGWSAKMNCIPACQIIRAELANTNPAVSPADTGWIDICPGDRVFFWGQGVYPQNGVAYNHSDLMSNFEWEFGDGNTTFGPNVSHIFQNPGGYIVQLKITDQLGCKNTNYLSQRIRVAPRPQFAVGDYPDQICSGDTVHLNAMVNSMDIFHTVSVLPGEGGFQTAGVRSDSLPLPDGNGASYTSTVTFKGFNPGQVLTSVDDLIGIFVNMEHSWMRDLEIKISCPSGKTITLHNHPGQIGGEVYLGIPYHADEGFPVPIPGIGFDYGWAPNPDYNYTWIQYANAFIPQTLPPGTYKSFQPLDSLVGCPLNGDWTITVTDLWAIDNGYIFSWSIEFDPSLYPTIEQFSPALVDWNWQYHPSIIFSMTDSIAGSPINAGQVAYTFIVQDEFGCAWDTTVQIQVLPFTHPDCHTCTEILTPESDKTICMGEEVGLDVFNPVATVIPVTFESYDDYPIGAGNHPPANPYNSIIKVNSIFPATITNVYNDIVSVCLDLDTDFAGDIRLSLVSPDNKVLILSNNNGGSGDNYTQTCFTTSATFPITAGSPPFTGNFLPQGNWTVLNGAPINGDWKLRISDAFGPNAYGKLNWWSITFNSKNNVTYTWSPQAWLSCSNCPNPTASPLSDFDYVVTATDSYGCTAQDSVHIAVVGSIPAPVVSLAMGPGQIIATWNDIGTGLGYQVNVNNTGWVPSNNGYLSHIVSGLTNDMSITVQVRAIVGNAACVVDVGAAAMTYLFCPIDAFLNNPGPFSVSCNGSCDAAVQISVVNGQAPFTFHITNLTTGNQSMQTTGNLTGLCAGSTIVVVEDAGGCLDTVSFTVNDQPAINVVATQITQPTCNGNSDGCASVSASGGVGGFTFVWNNPNMSTQQSICTLPAGPISVTATDMNGCSATTSVTITEPLPVTLSFSQADVKCKDGSDGTATVTASGGTGGYTYQWSGGLTPNSATATGLAANTYSVTVTDANGCAAFGNVTIGEPATGVQVTLAQAVTGCFGENSSVANATATGGTMPFTYLWSPSGQTTPVASNLAPGSYSLTVTDAGGCTASQSIQVQEWPAYNIIISASPPTCHDSDDAELAAVVLAGGNGTYTYQWSNGGTGDFIEGLIGGTDYTVTVTDSQGCSGTQTRFLDSPPAIVVSTAQTDALCNGAASGTASVALVQNATQPISYLWDLGAQAQTTNTAVDLVAGTYAVTVTDANGCTGSAATTVGEPVAIVTNFTITNNICFGYEEGTVALALSGGVPGYQVLWSNGATALNLANMAAGKYFVTVTDANGCTKLDSAFVSAPQRVDANISVKNVSCFGGRDGAITLSPEGGTPPYQYSLDGTAYFGSSTLIALRAGDYQVFIRDARGCVYVTPATVQEPPKIEAQILVWGLPVDEYMLMFGDSIPLLAEVTNAQGNVMYLWEASYCGTLSQDGVSDCEQTPFSGAVWAAPGYANTYYLTVIDEKGCEAEDLLKVHVKKERLIEVPTGFTPNNDGRNDILPVHGKSSTVIRLFQVFDRWGELLFQDVDMPINDITRGWDGTFKSREMPSGVYVWYLVAEFPDGMREAYRGETTLIR